MRVAGWFFVLLAFSLLLTSACGESAVERHHLASQVTATGLEITAGGIEAACRPVEELAPDAARRCRRAFEAHDALIAAWMLWVRTVATVEDQSLWMNAALALARLYQETAELLQELGVNAPDLPAFFSGGE